MVMLLSDEKNDSRLVTETLGWFEKSLLQFVGIDSSTMCDDPRWAEIRYKYTTLAISVIVVPTLAGVSMGFAVATFTKTPWAYLTMGAFWYYLILTIDRGLVVTLQRSPLAALIPAILYRLLLTLVISFVIAIPLELLIWQAEIQNKISESQKTELTQESKGLNDEYQLKLSPLYDQQNKLRNELQTLKQKCETLYVAATNEDIGGKTIIEYGDQPVETSGKPGQGRNYEAFRGLHQQCLTNLEQELNENFPGSKSQQLKEIADQIKELETKRNERIAERESKLKENNKLGAQIKALDQLGKENNQVRLAHLMFRAIILLLETFPLILKIGLLFTQFSQLREDSEYAFCQQKAKDLAVKLAIAQEIQITKVEEIRLRERQKRNFLRKKYSMTLDVEEFSSLKERRKKAQKKLLGEI